MDHLSKPIRFHYAYLFGILVLATLFRLPWLAEIPPGFYVDEASTGYDAYSLMLTSKDQYGEFLPLFARSFGEYNESLYRFVTIIPIRLFGLTEFAVRLPAAIIGIFTVLALYFLAKELFDKKVALLSAFLLTISPWHIQFSRIGFRAILLPFFFCWGLFFFFKGIKKPKYLLLSSLLFSIGLYTYASARVFIPLFLLALVLFFRQELRKAKHYTLISTGIFLMVFLFFTRYWLSPSGIAESLDYLDTNPIQLVQAYASYYSPDFLFLKGDPIARHSVANFGQLHLFELVTVPIGLFLLLRERQNRSWLLLVWLILYPLPGALTDAEHALRTIIGAPLFALISAYGLHKLFFVLRDKKRILLVGLTVVFIIWRVALYSQWYFVYYPIYSPKAWQYGMREAITYSSSKPYRNIYISDKFFIPHIFVLFYNRYPPEAYQQEALFSVGEGNLHYTDVSVDNYHIVSVQEVERLDHENALFLVFPSETNSIVSRSSCEEAHVIYRPDGSIASVLIECN